MSKKSTEDTSTKSKKPKSLKERDSLTKKDLKNLCSEYGLATSGNRATLFERVKNFLDLEPEEKKEEEQEDEEKEKEKEQKEPEEAKPKTIEKSDDEQVLIILNELFQLNLSRDSKDDLHKVMDGYNALIRSQPENEYILIHKGICLQYLQDYSGAVECYVKALKINPDNVEARILLEGCRVMGIAEAQGISIQKDEGMEAEAKIEPETATEIDEGEIKDIEIEAEPTEQISEEPPATKPAEPPEVPDADTARPSEAEKITPGDSEKKVEGKIQIAGAKKSASSPQSLLGEGFSSIDTKTLTESKSKLTNVLQQLKSELRKPADGTNEDRDSVALKGGGKAVSSDVSGIKPFDFEKQSLKRILESKKTDDDFGSKVLDSARKLLSISENLGGEGSDQKDDTSRDSIGTPLDTTDKPVSPETGAEGSDAAEVRKAVPEDVTDLIKVEEKPKEIEEEAVEEAEPEKEKVPSKPPERKRLRTGNVSFDKLLQGGLLSGSNILVDGPQFVGKEIFLYKFATLGFRMNVPCIIINPETAPATIKDTFNVLLGDISEYEKKNLLYWLDPESEDVKNRFKRDKPSELPELHQLILDGLEQYSTEIKSKFETYNLIFFSMTPLLIFQEPKDINRFLSRFSKKIKDDNVVAMYTIDNTMHEKQDINFVKRVMDGVIEIKQEEAGSDKRDPKKLIKIAKLPYAGSYEWHEYRCTDKNYEIRAIPTYKTVM
ncbi:MAG: hypothetical protein JSV49_06370 [Thermoplasmata archaeon]|nr:MAG: hypothetical protein JSV49_06370 [Thermoplasmata archaeon]